MTRMSVALLTLGDPGRVTGGYLYHQRLAGRAADHDAELRFVSVPELSFPFVMAAGPRWLPMLDATRADVLVLDSISAAAAAPWLRRVCVPVVGMLHQPPGGMDRRALRWLQAPFDRRAYRSARLLIAASEWLADELVRRGISRRRVRVIPPGRDPSAPLRPGDTARSGGRAAPAHETREDLRRGRRVAVLTVANWLPRKGIVELLEAFAGLPTDVATLHLVGDPVADVRYAARVRRRLASPRLRERVVVHGPVDAGRVAAMYAAADVFALPSFVEPYGTVWGEAMAAGLPVVGWRAGNLPYLADHERDALLVPPGDVRGLRGWLARLAVDEPLRRRLGAAAARRALERPTWDETAARFFSTVREAAG
ncbi:MAG TPA: glycosyltransferase family 4 protein [Candidatus Limnocylindria bacterium]|nr:glycosyltransferase family 4 protein [Candidatus Limnocylindria bacterium]